MGGYKSGECIIDGLTIYVTIYDNVLTKSGYESNIQIVPLV